MRKKKKEIIKREEKPKDPLIGRLAYLPENWHNKRGSITNPISKIIKIRQGETQRVFELEDGTIANESYIRLIDEKNN